jgi:methylglutamate dehydrogenase subunit D
VRVAELRAKSPCEGLLPLEIGGITLREQNPGVMTSVAPRKGMQKPLSAALKTAHGMAFPAPGRATGRAGARAIWFGRAHLLLIGPAPDPSLAALAALTDQSDAWAVVQLAGADADAVLARLVPVDLRAARFKRGATVRTELAHMMASITRSGAQAFQIMVMRSMAHTMVHELKTVMEARAARL